MAAVDFQLLSQESIVEEDEDLPKPDSMRIMRTNAPEWPFILVGGIASIVMGGSMPAYAILFGEVSQIDLR